MATAGQARDDLPRNQQTELSRTRPKGSFGQYMWRRRYYYMMLLPGIAYYLLFHYLPMYGIIIAFKDFSFRRGILGSDWIGFDNFRYLFQLGDFYRVMWNSIYLNFQRLIFGFPAPILLALMINEINSVRTKRTLQTVIYLPHFLSWVILGGIMVNFLSPSWGLVNLGLKNLGLEPIFFMGREALFRPIVVISSIWKEAGWGTIIYFAAISSVNPELYEAAIIDGANRFMRILHVTIPAILPTVIMLLILRLGNMMNNGFEQILVLQNAANMNVSQVFETYVYRIGLLSGRYSFGAAVGVFTSVVNLGFLLGANRLAKKTTGAGIW